MGSSSFDYFDEYSDFCAIKIEIVFDYSFKNLDPFLYEKPFGLFSNIVGELSFIKNINETKNEPQTILFKNRQNHSFILKRSVLDLIGEEIIDQETLKKNIKCANFIKHKMREYRIEKLCSALHERISIFECKFTYLSFLRNLVFEKISDYDNDKINLYPVSLNDIIKIFLQTIQIMKFYEKLKINHYGIKLSNISLKNSLIDYSECIFNSFEDDNSSFGIKDQTFSNYKYPVVYGYSQGYAAPEILKNFDEKDRNNFSQNRKDRFIHTYKADIYSFGIMALILSGAIKEKDLINLDIDRFKESEGKHKYITNLTNNIQLLEANKDAIRRFQLIVRSCLSFDPNERLSFKDLHRMLKNISNEYYSPEKMMQEIRYLQQKERQKKTKKELRQRILELEKIIQEKEELVKKYREFEEEEIYKNNILKAKIQKTNKRIQKHGKQNDNILVHEIEKLQLFFSDQKKKGDGLINEISILFDFIESTIKGFKEKEISAQRTLKDISSHNKFVLEENDFIMINNETPNLNFSKNELLFTHELQPASKAFHKIRTEIERKLEGNDYWHLNYMNLRKEEILEIIEIAKKEQNIKGIDFYGNKNYDEDCAKSFKNLILQNESIIGIDLCKLNLSSQTIEEFFKLFLTHKNIKFIVFDKGVLSESNLEGKTSSFSLNLSFF